MHTPCSHPCNTVLLYVMYYILPFSYDICILHSSCSLFLFDSLKLCCTISTCYKYIFNIICSINLYKFKYNTLSVIEAMFSYMHQYVCPGMYVCRESTYYVYYEYIFTRFFSVYICNRTRSGMMASRTIQCRTRTYYSPTTAIILSQPATPARLKTMLHHSLNPCVANPKRDSWR